jgi:predicted 2-oxoglutarate/Fe(II)-dependent dioxygenase YbiX
MCEINSDVTILEYRKGGLYAEHTDQSSNFNRAISISILLNDEFEGGEIAFFNRQYIPKVTKYQAIVFPANFAYPHEVLPITSGSRYSLIAWAS